MNRYELDNLIDKYCTENQRTDPRGRKKLDSSINTFRGIIKGYEAGAYIGSAGAIAKKYGIAIDSCITRILKPLVKDGLLVKVDTSYYYA